MRIIRRTFANLPSSILLLGRAGENNVTKLELDVSKEQSEFKDASFELVLKTPAADEPYPVVVEVTNNKLTYYFSGSDLAKSGYGQLEALVVGSEGEMLKSATAKIKINPSIIPNTYPGPLQKVIEDLKEAIGELEAHGIETVTELPDDPDDDEIVYLNAEESGFYRWDGSDWVRLTDDGKGLYELSQLVDALRDDIPTAADMAKWDAAYDDKHTHEDLPALNRITGTADAVQYNGKTIPLIAPDDVTPLGFAAYSGLVLRDDVVTGETIQDVPVFVQGEQGADICKLYAYDPGNEYDHVEEYDMIALRELRQAGSGMPVFALRVMIGGEYYVYTSIAWNDSGSNVVPAGWSQEGVSCSAPTISFTPNRMKVYIDGDYVTYDDLTALPAAAVSALRSLSQCINVSAAAMGTLTVPDDAVTRFNGTFGVNRKHAFITGDDCTFTLPAVPWSAQDAQFVLYLTCTTDIDLTFPSTVQFAGGAPDSSTGAHKLIGCHLPAEDAWAVGGIDYEAVT